MHEKGSHLLARAWKSLRWAFCRATSLSASSLRRSLIVASCRGVAAACHVTLILRCAALDAHCMEVQYRVKALLLGWHVKSGCSRQHPDFSVVSAPPILCMAICSGLRGQDEWLSGMDLLQGLIICQPLLLLQRPRQRLLRMRLLPGGLCFRSQPLQLRINSEALEGSQQRSCCLQANSVPAAQSDFSYRMHIPANAVLLPALQR